MDAKAKNIIEVSCVKHEFPDSSEIQICGLDFTVERGERVAVLGPTASGKTTLLKHILGLLEPKSGHVAVFGANPHKEYDKIRRRIGVVMQNVEEQIICPTVLEDVMFAPLNYGYSKESAKKMALKVMRELEIENLAERIPHTLSGGEKRKVALAGAIVLAPELLVLDEPFVGLDVSAQEELVQTLNKLNKLGVTIVLTLHDVDLVPYVADTMYLMKKGGRLSHRDTPEKVFATKGLVEKFGLKPPILARLFWNLNKHGNHFSITAKILEATAQLLPKIKK